jgi:hypothetical protein
VSEGAYSTIVLDSFTVRRSTEVVTVDDSVVQESGVSEGVSVGVAVCVEVSVGVGSGAQSSSN